MSMIAALIQELEQEAQTTRRVLERVPDAHLSWKPHEKAMTLGQLAVHVARTPGGVADAAQRSPVPVPSFEHQSISIAAELVPMMDQSVAVAREILSSKDDAWLGSEFRLMNGDQAVF